MNLNEEELRRVILALKSRESIYKRGAEKSKVEYCHLKFLEESTASKLLAKKFEWQLQQMGTNNGQ